MRYHSIYTGFEKYESVGRELVCTDEEDNELHYNDNIHYILTRGPSNDFRLAYHVGSGYCIPSVNELVDVFNSVDWRKSGVSSETYRDLRRFILLEAL